MTAPGSRARISRINWGLAALLVGALALYTLRYLTAAQTGVTQDDAHYLVLAESFLRGQPYRVISFPTAPLETVLPPGYPLFVLAPASLLVGFNYALLRAVSILLTLGSVLLSYVLVRPYLPSRAGALLVTALFALNPYTAGLAGMAMSEPAFVFFLLLHLVLLQRWTVQEGRLEGKPWVLPLLALTLAMAVLVRYQGLALVAASVIYLIAHRNYRQAAGLAAGFLLLLLPFVIFLRLNSLGSPGSLYATRMISIQLASLWQRLPDALWRYGTTIPLVMLPALGPRALEQAGSIGLAWLVYSFHLGLFALLVLGVIRGLIKRELPAIYAVAYFALILVVDNQGPNVIKKLSNEGRYSAAMLPFLYLYLYQGLCALGRLLRVEARTLSGAAGLIGSVVIAVLLWRNVQQARSAFPAPDLATGAAWVQSQTAADDVIMTRDPVGRYLYLRRRTVALSPEAFASLIGGAQSPVTADYVLIAPPLVAPDYRPNLAHELDPRDAAELLPAIQRDTEHFELVWQDTDINAFLYRVLWK